MQTTDRPFMTTEQAEEIVMANAVGMFRGTQSELAHAVLLMGNATKIGDGTAPSGFPAYRKEGEHGVKCTFNGCGHAFYNGKPAAPVTCGGIACDCPCCRMLAGEVVFGCRYGASDA